MLFSLDPLVLSSILSLCPDSLEKFHLQHAMTRSCTVLEMVVLVIPVDLLILSSMLSSIRFGCAGWCLVVFSLACFRFRLCLGLAFSSGSSC